METNAAPSLLTDTITTKAILEGWSVDSVTSRAGRTMFQVEQLHRFAAGSKGALKIIKTKKDLRELIAQREQEDERGKQEGAKVERTVGALLGIEGLHALDDKFENVQRFFEGGERRMK